CRRTLPGARRPPPSSDRRSRTAPGGRAVRRVLQVIPPKRAAEFEGRGHDIAAWPDVLSRSCLAISDRADRQSSRARFPARPACCCSRSPRRWRDRRRSRPDRADRWAIATLVLALALAAWPFYRQLSTYALVTEARAKAERRLATRVDALCAMRI